MNKKFGARLVSISTSCRSDPVVKRHVMALSPLRTLLRSTLRNHRRTLTSLSDAPEKRLLSQDDWTAFQVQRAERSNLS